MPCKIEWHEGFRLSVEELEKYPEYRGEDIVQIGRQIAVNGYLDAKIIGEEVIKGDIDPQVLKKVWHYIARFG